MPPRLDRIVLAALERDADRRPKTASAFSAELEDLLRESPRRQPRVIMAVASALVLGAGVLLAAISMGHSPAPPAQAGAPAAQAVDIERLVEAVQKVPAAAEPSEAPAMPDLPDTDAAADDLEVEVAEVLALTERGQKIRAHHRMKELAALHPASPRVQSALVTTARGVAAWGEAMQAARRWVELEPSAAGYLALAKLQRATLDPAATETLGRVLALEPEHVEARRLLDAYSQKRVAVR